MSSIAFCVPAALQLVMPPCTQVSQNVPFADIVSNYPGQRGVFTEVKKASLVCLHESLTLEQSILAHEADKEPENNADGILSKPLVCTWRGATA